MTRALRALLIGYQQRLPAWTRISIAVLWAAMIWYLSSRSSFGTSMGWIPGVLWNCAHVVVFGVLAGLILLSSQGNIAVRFRLAVSMTVFYGAIDELHQGFVPGRGMDLWDVCSDGLGAALFGCTVWWLLTRQRRPGVWILPLAVLALGSASMAS